MSEILEKEGAPDHMLSVTDNGHGFGPSDECVRFWFLILFRAFPGLKSASWRSFGTCGSAQKKKIEALWAKVARAMPGNRCGESVANKSEVKRKTGKENVDDLLREIREQGVI